MTQSKLVTPPSSPPPLISSLPFRPKLKKRPKFNIDSPGQSLLNSLATSFPLTLNPNLPQTLRIIKDLFLERDFHGIFTNSSLLESYSVAYAGGRGICYLDFFLQHEELHPYLISTPSTSITPSPSTSSSSQASKTIVCLGGGCGSELLGLWTAWKVLMSRQPKESESFNSSLNRMISKSKNLTLSSSDTSSMSPSPSTLSKSTSVNGPEKLGKSSPFDSVGGLHIVGLDFGDWNSIWHVLSNSLIQDYSLSPNQHSSKFIQEDLLSSNLSSQSLQILSKAHLTTCFFTLNELLQSSIPKTLKFLSQVIKSMTSGSGFLVIDSAGSFSDLKVNGKIYGMWNLLDLVFGCGGEKGVSKDPIETFKNSESSSQVESGWEKVLSTESTWFRGGGDLNYPIKLANVSCSLCGVGDIVPP